MKVQQFKGLFLKVLTAACQATASNNASSQQDWLCLAASDSRFSAKYTECCKMNWNDEYISKLIPFQ